MTSPSAVFMRIWFHAGHFITDKRYSVFHAEEGSVRSHLRLTVTYFYVTSEYIPSYTL